MVTFRPPLHPSITHPDVPFVWERGTTTGKDLPQEKIAAIAVAVVANLPRGRIVDGTLISEMLPDLATPWRFSALNEQTSRWGE